MSSNPRRGVVTADLLRGRTAPTLTGEVVRNIAKGKSLTILEEAAGGAYNGPDGSTLSNWLLVQSNHQQFYVAAAYVRMDSPPRVLHGAWIPESRHCSRMLTRDGICQLLDALVEQGINAVFPAVWNRGYTAFPSKTMQRLGFFAQDPRYIENGPFDPVATITKEAKVRHLLVVPWLEYGFCSPKSYVDGNALTELRPEWCSQNAYGNVVDDEYVMWLNSLHPDVQQLLLDLALELVQNYDIDGIQGDDHWPAMHKNAGHDEATKQLYRSENGCDPPLDCDNQVWTNWRVGKITDYLRRVVQEVHSLKPSALICMGSSLFTYGRNLLMQDGEDWIRQGLVDLFHPQIYRQAANAYRNELQKGASNWPDEWRQRLAPGIHLKAGSNWLQPDELVAMVEANRELKVAGEVFFTAELLQMMPNDLATALQVEAEYEVSAVLPSVLRRSLAS
jgi:uncharacterized lipoprotein YddW (UPF0748 family)